MKSIALLALGAVASLGAADAAAQASWQTTYTQPPFSMAYPSHASHIYYQPYGYWSHYPEIYRYRDNYPLFSYSRHGDNIWLSSPGMAVGFDN